MKLKNGFIMTELGEEYVLIPTGEPAAGFHGVIRLNDTGAFLAKQLKDDVTEETLTEALMAEYEVLPEIVRRDVVAVLEKLRAAGLIEE